MSVPADGEPSALARNSIATTVDAEIWTESNAAAFDHELPPLVFVTWPFEMLREELAPPSKATTCLCRLSRILTASTEDRVTEAVTPPMA